MGIMESPLRQLGVECQTRGGFAPVEVKGPLKGGKVLLDGSVSSQFLTGLLFALPVCDGPSEIEVLNLKSAPYVAMTLAVLKQFGVTVAPEKSFERFIIKGNQRYKASSYQVEGDWSGAAFLLIAGAIRGKVTIQNLQTDSLQADKRILEVLDSVKAKVSITEGAVSVEKNELRAFDFDATDCPDLIPPLVALACHCTGRSMLYGMDRLKYKESDRASVLLSEFAKIGASIVISGNQMEIEGKSLKGGHVDTHNDHRIAMAGAIAGLNSKDGVIISGWKCVAKSYPDFFRDLEALKGETA
jgi:3-phosphoshikimate 1-carboxyvinyltransferase